MSDHPPWRILLGPQRPAANVDRAIEHAHLDDDAPIAVISAAWQEAEGDLSDLRQYIKNPLTDLAVYQRADHVFATDAALHAAYRERQDQLKEQQRMYRLRLKQLSIAARKILDEKGTPALVADERRHAISQLRALDRHHLNQMHKINDQFNTKFNVEENNLLADDRAAMVEELARCKAVLITGGNVVVLLNRLNLFGLGSVLREKNIIAWSAGAMVLCDRIVLFHDRLPQGRRDAEVMSEGLGLVSDIVVLPNAHGRLRKNEPLRAALFSRRFSPEDCLTLDNGSLLMFRNNRVVSSVSVQHISRDGKVARVKAV